MTADEFIWYLRVGLVVFAGIPIGVLLLHSGYELWFPKPTPSVVVWNPSPGDIITCPNGHELYRVTEHLARYSLLKARQFERIDPLAQEPTAGDPTQPCPHCDERWLLAGCANFKGHGWWPRNPRLARP